MLVHNYEIFKMHKNECIAYMFTRVTITINGLKFLNIYIYIYINICIYTYDELMRKVLRYFPKSWDAKEMTI